VVAVNDGMKLAMTKSFWTGCSTLLGALVLIASPGLVSPAHASAFGMSYSGTFTSRPDPLPPDFRVTDTLTGVRTELVFALDFRQSQEAPYPASILDINLGVRWASCSVPWLQKPRRAVTTLKSLLGRTHGFDTPGLLTMIEPTTCESLPVPMYRVLAPAQAM
jgi:hypothetical protein